MDNQLTLPPSPERPNYQPLITEQRHPPQKWVLIFGRFVSDVTTQIVNIVARLFINEQEDTQNEREGTQNEQERTKKNTKIDKRAILHLHSPDEWIAKSLAFEKARQFEKNGQIIKAGWLRAKATEGIFAPLSEEQKQSCIDQLHRFTEKDNGFGDKELGRGSEGRAALVFKGLNGPLKVKKELFEKNDDYKAEIALLQRLDHKNIVKLVPIENPAEGEDYVIVMKYGGESLQKLVPGGENRIPPLPPGLFVSIAKQMADVLYYLREEQVLHRDIKPENIVIDQGGNISLIDFGLAYDRKAGAGSWPVGLGTVDYIEPEPCAPVRKTHSDTDDMLQPYRFTVDGNMQRDASFGGMLSDTADMFAAGQTLYKLIVGSVLVIPKLNGLRHGNDKVGGKNWQEYKEYLGIPKVIETSIAKALEGQEEEYITQVTDLISKMIEPDSQLRITPEQLKNHPLLRDE